jgi:hypothetical protein
MDVASVWSWSSWSFCWHQVMPFDADDIYATNEVDGFNGDPERSDGHRSWNLGTRISRLQKPQPYNYYGGYYKPSPAVIKPGCNGQLNVVVNLGGFARKCERFGPRLSICAG